MIIYHICISYDIKWGITLNDAYDIKLWLDLAGSQHNLYNPGSDAGTFLEKKKMVLIIYFTQNDSKCIPNLQALIMSANFQDEQASDSQP